ncbi:MAG: hypothetical protein ACKVS8_07810 [Phycisphaerales bacterium]
MGLPFRTVEFWLVTFAFAGALVYLLRGVLPIPSLSARSRRQRGERRAKLTIGGRPVSGTPAAGMHEKDQHA